MTGSSRLRRLTRWLIPGSLVAACCLAPTDAEAAGVQGANNKRFRIHGEFDLLSFYHYNPDGDGASFNGGGFGPGRTTLIDSGGPFGFGAVLHPRPVWSLGFGFLFAKERALIGAKFAFAVDGYADDDADDPDDDHVTLVSGQFVPYFRWIFMPGRQFRPFVEGHFGFGGGAIVFNNDALNTRTNTNIIWPNVGGGGGVHLFIIDAFSIDLALMFDYFAPHNQTDIDGPGPGDQDEDFDKAGDLLDLSAQVGMSFWF